MSRQITLGNLIIDSFSPPVIDKTGKRQLVTSLTLAIAASQRFVIGAENGKPFLGAQDYDLEFLSEIGWHYADMESRDAAGNAWVRLNASPFQLADHPNLNTGIKPLILNIPASPLLITSLLPIAKRAKTLTIRRIKVGHDNNLIGIGRTDLMTIPLGRLL